MADAFNGAGDSTKAAQLYLELLKQLPDVPPIRDRIHAKLTEIYLRGSRAETGPWSNSKRSFTTTRPIPRRIFLASLPFDEKKLPEAVGLFWQSDFAQAGLGRGLL